MIFPGVDSAANTWTIPGDGTQLAAFIAKADAGRYAVRAALLAYESPDKIPSQIRVFGELTYDNDR